VGRDWDARPPSEAAPPLPVRCQACASRPPGMWSPEVGTMARKAAGGGGLRRSWGEVHATRRPDWLRVGGRWAGEEIACVLWLGDDLPTRANASDFLFFTVFDAGNFWRTRLRHMGLGGVDPDDQPGIMKFKDRAEALADAVRQARELMEDVWAAWRRR
jgi:hypothetical protein